MKRKRKQGTNKKEKTGNKNGKRKKQRKKTYEKNR